MRKVDIEKVSGENVGKMRARNGGKNKLTSRRLNSFICSKSLPNSIALRSYLNSYICALHVFPCPVVTVPVRFSELRSNLHCFSLLASTKFKIKRSNLRSHSAIRLPSLPASRSGLPRSIFHQTRTCIPSRIRRTRRNYRATLVPDGFARLANWVLQCQFECSWIFLLPCMSLDTAVVW